MRIRHLGPALCLLLAACVGSQQVPQTMRAKFDALQVAMQQAEGQGGEPLSPEQLDAVEEAYLAGGHFTEGDLAAIATFMTFVASSKESELDEMVAFAASKDGSQLLWPTVLMSIHRQHYDDAARLIVTVCLPLSSQQRPYRVWKWWEYAAYVRPDYFEATRDLSLALLKRFENAGKEERWAIQDILGKPSLTKDSLPDLRKTVFAAYARQTKDWERSCRSDEFAKPATVWVKDRNGLREMKQDAFRRYRRLPWREELVFRSGWGSIWPHDLMVAEQGAYRTAELLKRAIELVGDKSQRFELPNGVVHVFNRLTNFERQTQAGEIGVAVATMLERYVRAFGLDSKGGKPSAAILARKQECDRILLAALRAAGGEAKRLLAGSGSPYPDYVFTADSVAILVKAASDLFGEVGGTPQEHVAWSHVQSERAHAFFREAGAGLQFVEFSQGVDRDRYGKIEVTVMQSSLVGATIAAPDRGEQQTVTLRATDKMHRYEILVPGEGTDFTMRRYKVDAMIVRCADAKQQQELAAQLGGLVKSGEGK